MKGFLFYGETLLKVKCRTPLELFDKLMNWDGLATWRGIANSVRKGGGEDYLIRPEESRNTYKNIPNCLFFSPHDREPERLEMKVMEMWEAVE